MTLIKNITKDAEGNVQLSWKLTPEEASYLINYAISDLLAKGIATVEEFNLEDLEVEGGVQ